MEDPAAPNETHICFLAASIYPTFVGSKSIQIAGGGEVQQTVLANVLHDKGFKVSVVTGDYDQPDIVHHRGIDVYRVPSPGRRGIKGLRVIYPVLSDMVSVLKRVSPDIVYFCVAGSHAAAAAWYSNRYKKKFIYQCGSDREFVIPILGVPWKDSMLFRWALRRADGIIVQNVVQQRQLFDNYNKRGVIIPTLYTESSTKKAQAGNSVLWVGTLKPIKRADLFIELAKRLPEHDFVMVGGPDHSNDPDCAYFNRMRDLALNVKNLKFVGYVPFQEVGEYFNRASLFVNTSDSEGFPNTFMQAWIRGVPTLSFVAPEIQAGRSGSIRCTDINDMAGKVKVLATDAMTWSKASSSAAANFDETHSVSAVLPLYRSLFDSMLHDGVA